MPFNDVANVVIDVVDDLAIAVSAMLVQPWNDPGRVQLLVLEKLKGLPKSMVTLRRVGSI